MFNASRKTRTRSALDVLPLMELLKIEGWQFQFTPEKDGTTSLTARNHQFPEPWCIRAADEETAVRELAKKTGWKYSH